MPPSRRHGTSGAPRAGLAGHGDGALGWGDCPALGGK